MQPSSNMFVCLLFVCLLFVCLLLFVIVCCGVFFTLLNYKIKPFVTMYAHI